MTLREEYCKEIGYDINKTDLFLSGRIAKNYVEWLEKRLEETSLVKHIKNMYEYVNKKGWNKLYIAIDLHGTTIKPDYNRDTNEMLFYPFAKETLQLLTEREDIVLIMYTSSYPDEIKKYIDILNDNGINFNYINSNPEVSEEVGSFGYYKDKMYFNVLLEDKASFNPSKDWEPIFNYFSTLSEDVLKKTITRISKTEEFNNTHESTYLQNPSTDIIIPSNGLREKNNYNLK